jgi:hypothetical protein
MDQNETVALFLEGRVAWNSWAFSLLRERETIKWARDVVGRITPVDEVGRNWLSKAEVDFTGYHFGSEEQSYPRPENANPRVLTPNIVFEGFAFPDAATFAGAKFVGLTSFNQAHFLGRSSFQNCNFFDDALFFGTIFEGTVIVPQGVV